MKIDLTPKEIVARVMKMLSHAGVNVSEVDPDEVLHDLRQARDNEYTILHRKLDDGSGPGWDEIEIEADATAALTVERDPDRYDGAWAIQLRVPGAGSLSVADAKELWTQIGRAIRIADNLNSEVN